MPRAVPGSAVASTSCDYTQQRFEEIRRQWTIVVHTTREYSARGRTRDGRKARGLRELAHRPHQYTPDSEGYKKDRRCVRRVRQSGNAESDDAPGWSVCSTLTWSTRGRFYGCQRTGSRALLGLRAA